MFDELAKYAVVDVRMDESRGHDVLGGYLRMALGELGHDVVNLHLKPEYLDIEIPRDILTMELWEKIEDGKRELAKQAEMKGLLTGLAGNLIEAVGKRMRNSEFITDVLKRNYRSKLSDHNGDIKALISSHYMAFEQGFPYTQIYSAPDLYIHESVANLAKIENLKVFSSSEIFRQEMINVGIDKGRIIDTGVILPDSVISQIPERLENQRLVDEGTRNHKALVTLGAGMPEREEALKAIEVLMSRGVDVTVICGDGREKCIDFRNAVEAIEVPDGVSLELIGGLDGFSREEEVQAHISCMSNPDFTVCISRPNETSLIATAVGMRLIFLNPFQQHEVKADAWLSQNSENTTHFNDGNFEFPSYYSDLLEDDTTSWVRPGRLTVDMLR